MAGAAVALGARHHVSDGVGVPFVAVALLWLMNRRELLGDAVNRWVSNALGLAVVNTLVLHVFVHVLRLESPVVHMSAFAVNAGSAIASYPFWNWLAKKKGKPFAFRAGLALSTVTFVSVFFVGPGDLVGLYAVMVFGGAANVGFWMLMHALAADVTLSGWQKRGLMLSPSRVRR